MFHDFKWPFLPQDRAVPIEYDNALSSNEYLNKLIKYVKDWTEQFKTDFLEFASERFLNNDAEYSELNTENKRIIGAINEVEQLALQKETFVGNYGTTPFKLYYDAYKKYNFVAVHKGEYGAVTSDTYYVFNKYIKAPSADLESYMSFIELRAEAIDNDSWKLGATEVVVTGYEDGHGATNYELREIDVTDGAILENQFYVWQGRDGNEFFQTYHNLIQNIYDRQMEYYKCVYDGSSIKHGDTVLTYNDIVEAYHDDNKFLFLEANGLTMIPCFPPVEGDPVIEFTSSWIEGGKTTISRVIVNSDNEIKFEDVEVTKRNDFDALASTVVNMGQGLGKVYPIYITYYGEVGSDNGYFERDGVTISLNEVLTLANEYNVIILSDDLLDTRLYLSNVDTDFNIMYFSGVNANSIYSLECASNNVKFREYSLNNYLSYNLQTPTDEQVTHARANLKTFVLTQAEYDALTTKDANALYHIKES